MNTDRYNNTNTFLLGPRLSHPKHLVKIRP